MSEEKPEEIEIKVYGDMQVDHSFGDWLVYPENPTLWFRIRRFLPIWYYNESLRTFTFQLWNCSVTHKSLTKLHRFDVLITNHRKWWQPKYIGFTIWFC